MLKMSSEESPPLSISVLVGRRHLERRDDLSRLGFGRKDVVEYLLSQNANVHMKDDGGLIPLHNAASFGHAEVVQLLIDHHSEVNALDNWKYSPLAEAASKGKVDVCLSEFSSNQWRRHLSTERFSCVVLLQHGADPHLKNSDGKSALDLADSSTRPVLTGTRRCSIVRRQPDVEHPHIGDYRKDELLEAARAGDEEKLAGLLNSTNVNSHASDGRRVCVYHPCHSQRLRNSFSLLQSTPLHLACMCDEHEVIALRFFHLISSGLQSIEHY